MRILDGAMNRCPCSYYGKSISRSVHGGNEPDVTFHRSVTCAAVWDEMSWKLQRLAGCWSVCRLNARIGM